MLVNLNHVIEQQYLIHESFYTDANLMQCFGGSTVLRNNFGSEQKLGGNIIGFGAWVGSVDVGARPIEGISFRFDWSNLGDELLATLRVNVMGETTLGFEDVERVFGNTWRQPVLPPSPHATPRLATHAHGNETIEFIYSSSSIRQELTIAFRSDGTINLLSLRAKWVR
jgi:hypothetical protein